MGKKSRLHKSAKSVIVENGLRERLTPAAATVLLLQILERGRVDISPHAWKEMEDDGMTVQDVYQVLRGGVVEPGELVAQSWRYRVRQARRYVVVTFRRADWTVVVTVWRGTP
jgi:hypothetical protein